MNSPSDKVIVQEKHSQEGQSGDRLRDSLWEVVVGQLEELQHSGGREDVRDGTEELVVAETEDFHVNKLSQCSGENSCDAVKYAYISDNKTQHNSTTKAHSTITQHVPSRWLSSTSKWIMRFKDPKQSLRPPSNWLKDRSRKVRLLIPHSVSPRGPAAVRRSVQRVKLQPRKTI